MYQTSIKALVLFSALVSSALILSIFIFVSQCEIV
nr:MAG TPA: hypothetical protein [Caudoviricetes sp.]